MNHDFLKGWFNCVDFLRFISFQKDCKTAVFTVLVYKRKEEKTSKLAGVYYIFPPLIEHFFLNSTNFHNVNEGRTGYDLPEWYTIITLSHNSIFINLLINTMKSSPSFSDFNIRFSGIYMK